MKTSVRAAVTAVLAAPLVAAVFAAPANAAPEDAAFSTLVEGNEITINVVNNTQFKLACAFSAAAACDRVFDDEQVGTDGWANLDTAAPEESAAEEQSGGSGSASGSPEDGSGSLGFGS
ncbi:hypothetical protein [Rhodococcus sp. NPDC049939]|uniref:hypothetical protein n=1 Tax=Rhodococcus sp. NPDC049939 TaxID=3155511 RepID=UPI0033F5FF19